jgi:riboflavin synthase alpha subunit
MVENSRQEREKTKIGLSVGLTVNLGNYESLRVDLWKETYEEKTFDDLKEELTKELDKQLTELSKKYK